MPSKAFHTALHAHSLSDTETTEKSGCSSLGLLAAGSVSMDTTESDQSDDRISRKVLNGPENVAVLSSNSASKRGCQ